MAHVSKIKVPINGTLTEFEIDTQQAIVKSTEKTYLTGVTTAPTTSATPQTGVADTSVYTRAGQLNSTEVRIAEKVKQQYNSSTESLDFIFE